MPSTKIRLNLRQSIARYDNSKPQHTISNDNAPCIGVSSHAERWFSQFSRHKVLSGLPAQHSQSMADWQSVVVNGTTGLKGYFHANLNINQFRVGSNTHDANVRSIKRSISLPSANAHNDAAGSWLPDNPHPTLSLSLGRGGGYVHDTCKQREREGNRKNLVLVYLIFTFQLFFGPPTPLFRLASSHNFFRCFPFIASAFLSQFSFCKSSLPFACLLWLWSSSKRLLVPVFTPFLLCLSLPPLSLWNFHKVFVLLKMEYIINRICREREGTLDTLSA